MGPAPPRDTHLGASTTIGIDEVVDRPDTPPPTLAHGSEEHDYDALLLEYLRDTRADEGNAEIVLGRVLLVDAVEERR